MTLYDGLWIVLGVGGLILAVREGLGFWDRRDGYVTISELARHSVPLRVAIGLLFAALTVWWIVHSSPRIPW